MLNMLVTLRATMYQMVRLAGELQWGKTSTGKCNSGFGGSMFGGRLLVLSGMLALI